MAGRRQHALVAVAIFVLLCAGAAVALAFTAAPAHAFDTWQHDGATGCVCHGNGAPTDATCTACHAGFVSVPGNTCWSCHFPGQDTSSLSSPSSACSQGCHLYSPVDKGYTVAFTHGANPHLGSTPACLDCHPGQSPHHNGAQQFDNCTACHNGFQKHAGKNVPQNKCATCHKGTGSGGAAQAQHSANPTKKSVCSTCHNKALHAKKRGSHITSCGRCHKSKFHAAQKIPSSSVCLSCHGRAARHSTGYGCALCHRSAVHNARPTVIRIR